MKKALIPKPDAIKVAILATDGFEQDELDLPHAALLGAGFDTEIVSLKSGKVTGMRHAEKGKARKVDRTLSKARSRDYDALMLPGGLMNPDALRRDPRAVKFVQAFWKAGKPVAAICHGPQLLIEADVVRGRTMTSFPSVKTDLRNAGARWVNRKVVVDRNLVTSRQPADIPAFNRAMIRLFRGKRNRPTGGFAPASPALLELAAPIPWVTSQF